MNRILRTLSLIVIVIVSGGAVMVYEFIAVRILQRFFGSALDVWAAEISVCLAGLAIGYSVGGFLADRYRSWVTLGVALSIGGATAFFMEPLTIAVQAMVTGTEVMRWWEPLVVAGASSFLPILALGTIMPQAIRLYVSDLTRVGTGAGRIGSLSTVGSIAGVLLTALVLMRWGVRESLYATSGVLIGVGALVIVVNAMVRRPKTVALLAALFVLSCRANGQVLYENYSAYHHMLVKDAGATRELFFDSDAQSSMNKENPAEGGFEYTEYFHVPMILDPTIKSVLFVGLGGGTGPKSFLKHYPDVKIDVAEIDPAVVDVAHKYFAVPEDARLRIVTTDGRTFLQRTKNVYGAILMDAYGSGPHGAYIPFHLATQEFFQATRARIAPGGCLVYNVMGVLDGSNDDVVRGMMVTLESVFPSVYAFQAESSYNTVFVAQNVPKYAAPASTGAPKSAWPIAARTDYPITVDQWAAMIAQLRRQNHYLPEKMERRITQWSAVIAAPRTGKLFTDNNAPVDLSQGLR